MSDTICEKFLEIARKQPEKIAIMYKRGDRWNEMTWAGYHELVQSIAAGLQIFGVRKGDRVAILANTRYEWAATDLAILGLGAITVPIYQNSTPEDIALILRDSEAKVLICETSAQIIKLRQTLATEKDLKVLESVVVFDVSTRANSDPHAPSGGVDNDRILPFSELRIRGEAALKLSPTLYELAVRELNVDDPATVVYTSGTTGLPRGVLHTHVQIMSEIGDAFPLLGVTPRDRSLCFLPYAHVLGRIEIWGHAYIGYTMAFAQGVDRLKEDLIDVKPTIMIAVPRIFEKIYNGILAQAEISPVKNKVFQWALEVGREISRFKIDKQPPPIDLALKYQLARRLVFNTIAERLGGRLRFAISGGAPLSPAIAQFFHAAGLLVLEGYGLTETLAAITVNTPFDYRFGTVGKPIGDVRLKLADDGEILVLSKKVTVGYYKDPQATERNFNDGWFRTGDIGEISDEGYLRITDRKKELIKTAGGKYVAPQKLEGLLKASPLISQVLIHGDQRKYIVALLTLDVPMIERFASENGIVYKDREALVNNSKVREFVRQAVANANKSLASYESIKNFAIVPREFSIESGEMTPSLKLRRKIIEQNHQALIESLYGTAGTDGRERPRAGESVIDKSES